jgi:Putative transposase
MSWNSPSVVSNLFGLERSAPSSCNRLEGLPGQWQDATQDDTLDAPEFMRRFLLHVLPAKFHRIRRNTRKHGLCH